MSAVCCWRLPLMWAIQYQQEFWNGILSSSGSVSGNLIRRDTYTYNLQFVLIIHIGVLKWQSTINNLFTSGCFVFFVYRSSQCSQRFWLFKNKNETQCNDKSTIYPQYINRLLKNKTTVLYSRLFSAFNVHSKETGKCSHRNPLVVAIWSFQQLSVYSICSIEGDRIEQNRKQNRRKQNRTE